MKESIRWNWFFFCAKFRLIYQMEQNGQGIGGPVTEAIHRGRVKSSRVPLAALGTIFLSTLCNAEFS